MIGTTSRLLLGAALTAAAPALFAAPVEKLDGAQLEFFEKKIRPVLATKCYSCHSATEKIKGGLSLDNKQGVLTGGDSGPSIVPGKPDKSILIEAISRKNDDLKMPPKDEDALTSEQINDFKQWVQMGAPDPRAGAAARAMKAITVADSRKHWAFQPIANPPVPKVKDSKSWTQTPIDAFILEKLQEKKLAPAPKTDRRALARRIAYDLTGLPPTPEEVEDFVNDKSADAVAKLVDHYLASERYGERWGRHWLDVARYADNTGDRLNRGEPRYPFAWTYRDYVIEAFNKDMPFDQFIKEQIAADKLINVEKDNLAALGFLTVGKRFMGNIEDIIDDRIDVVTQGFMALTVSCARCHDHKFDPIPTKDYYSLHGVFANSTEPRRGPFLVEPTNTAEYQDFQKKMAELTEEVDVVRDREYEQALAAVRKAAGDILMATTLEQKGKGMQAFRAFLREKGINLNAFQHWERALKRMEDKPGAVMAPWFEYRAIPAKEFASKAGAVTEKIAASSDVNPLVAAALKKAQPKSIADVAAVYGKLFNDIEKSYVALKKENASGKTVMADENEEAIRLVLHDSKSPLCMDMGDARRLVGGAQIQNLQGRVYAKIYELETTHPGSPARAMVLQDSDRIRESRVLIRGERGRFGDSVPRQFLEILEPEGKREPFKNGSGRIDLANEIASRDNPLTARVIVNRIWAQHFGEGLVRTLSDFGLRAEPPSHPQLLDWLATWFMDNGWSVKKLHKLILTSAVYQQSYVENKKYAEVDPANLYLWRMPLRRLDFEAIRDTLLLHGGNADLSMGGTPVNLEANPYPVRRTVYGLVDRQALPEMFRTFDFANPDMTTAQRQETTVPQQALFMMNSPMVIEQAKQMVRRSEFQGKSADKDKVTFLYQQLFQRQPSASELSAAVDYVLRERGQEQTGEGVIPWSYGIGTYDAKGKSFGFREFPDFNNDEYGFGRNANARQGRPALTATGGRTTSNQRMAVVRRWTAPRDGKVTIEAELVHDSDKGDGVQGRIISNTKGELGKWTAQNNKQRTDIAEFEVKKGDIIDFAVECRQTDAGDDFTWAPIIRMSQETEWDAKAQFDAPLKNAKEPLTAWEKLAQVLFLTNEFVFVN
ncbi:MAG: PSD1 and planctomycete cytochrome C domain-containing protein [Verrucomicrobiota bacterium]